MRVTSALVVEGLVAGRNCGRCGGRYGIADIHVLARHGRRTWDLAALCRECCTLSLIRVVACRSSNLRAPSVADSEVAPAEAPEGARPLPVSRADVARVAAFLATFDGDFEALFGRRRDRS